MHYKLLKKITGALGFKIIDKNLVKNERLIRNYNYLTLSKILKKLFDTGIINSVIQIGSNDGVRFDHLNQFIKKYIPFTIFIEPIKLHFEELKKNYPKNKNFIFENLAISVNNEIQALYKVIDGKVKFYDEHIMGITSFDKNHLIKHGVKNRHIEKVKVNSLSIKDLLKKYSIKSFDLLFIDTEGYDPNIVLDFIETCEMRPIILFEYIHAKNDILKKTLKLLEDKKFDIFKIDENLICLPEEKKIKII